MLTSVIELGFVVHVTELVTSTCCPFAVAVALNCSVDPYLMLVSVEVTLIAVIFRKRDRDGRRLPLTDPSAPVITEVPGETPVTMPVVLSMVATCRVALLQKTPLPGPLWFPSQVAGCAHLDGFTLLNLAVGRRLCRSAVGLTKKPLHPSDKAQHRKRRKCKQDLNFPLVTRPHERPVAHDCSM